MIFSKTFQLKAAFIAIILFFTANAFCQEEALLTDINSCTGFYWQGSDISKQIKKSHDTMTYFHDGEIIVFYNEKESHNLTKNTFYVFNHGFNKMITMRILMVQIKAWNNKKDEKTFVTSPESYFNVYYEDSLSRCGRMIAGPMEIHIGGYKNALITALYVELSYYNQQIFRWFIKEPKVPEELIPLIWKRE